MNNIEERIKKAKTLLQSRRRSGRTTRMLEGVVEKSSNEEGYHLVLGHTPDWCRSMLEMTVNKIKESNINYKERGGNAIELENGAVILFRTSEWWDQPRNYNAIEPASVVSDNVLSDMKLEKHIRFLEMELNEFKLPAKKFSNGMV